MAPLREAVQTTNRQDEKIQPDQRDRQTRRSRRPRTLSKLGGAFAMLLAAAAGLALIANASTAFADDDVAESDASVSEVGPEDSNLATEAIEAEPAPVLLMQPPPGGTIYKMITETDPASFAASQPYEVQSLWVYDVVTQQFRIYIPDAPEWANTLTAEQFSLGAPVGIRRASVVSGFVNPVAPEAAPPVADAGAQVANRLPVPPRGGLTIGRVGVASLENLILEQGFEVETILLLDVPTQTFLRYIPKAPAWVNTLTSEDLRPDSVVFIRRADTDPAFVAIGGPNGVAGGFAAAPGAPSADDPSSLSDGSDDDPSVDGADDGSDPADADGDTPSNSSATPLGSNGTRVTYAVSNAAFPNPERGFYQATHSTSGTLDAGRLRSARDSRNITLVMRYYMLSDFRFGDISSGYLAAMQADFDAARAAGVKIIPRFSYTNSYDGSAPYGDASQSQILRHIDQLTPVLRANSDVIAAVQAGFIGVWGEWAFTDHFEDPNSGSYPGREVVLKRLLSAVPADRMVQVRTPSFKYQISLSGAEAARVGFHNDCFLSGPTDTGTYRSGSQTTSDRSYLSGETHTVVMGGETCTAPTSRDSAALDELAQFHWSYLNADFHEQQIARWRADGRYNTIDQLLGYRIELLEGAYVNQVRPGDALTVDLSLRNAGWAAPYNPRNVELVLRGGNGTEYRATLPADAQSWRAGSSARLQYDACLPSNLAAGSYQLFLHLADPAPSLHNRSEFAIRTANQGLWESGSGYNNLQHSVTVSASAPARPCGSSVQFR